MRHWLGARGVVAGALVTSLVSGCSTLPASGPNDDAAKGASASLTSAQQAVKLQYALVDLTPPVVANLGLSQEASLYGTFGGGRGPAPEIYVGVGDTVQVTVFESAAGGLFIPQDAGARPGNFVTLPSQTVDKSGTLSVPYAGLIRAAGRSTRQIERDVESKLANRAIEPQVIVARLNERASEAAVLGEVNGPNKFAVNPAGDRVTDMISRAGGLRYPDYESYVTLQRGGRSVRVFFRTLIANPQENIYISPGDTLVVDREQRSFLAFGANGVVGQFNFDRAKLTLAEAVAQAGGPLDGRADPSQVYLYRMENRLSLERAGVNLSQFPPTQSLIPTIFRSNFRDAASFFTARSFVMRDKDLIYTSNASSVELLKFLTVVNAVSGSVSGVATDAADVRNAVHDLKH
jgi:polysaccharide biosynthesis/export protein